VKPIFDNREAPIALRGLFRALRELVIGVRTISPPPAGALHAVDHERYVVDHDLPHAVNDLPSFGPCDPRVDR
jgi:hypothetical protein